MAKTKQLNLIFDDLAQKLDPLIEELINTINATKSLAYWVECNLGSHHPALGYCIWLATELSEIGRNIAPQTNKYYHTDAKYWAKRGLYDPIYGPVDPRSAQRLYEIALDHNNRLKRIILRLDKLTHKPYDKCLDLSFKLVKSLYDEKFEL